MRSCMLLVVFIFAVSVDSVEFKQPIKVSRVFCTRDPVTEAINGFSLKLANKLGTRRNVFYSPFSIYTVLTMAELGAGGKTKAEIQKVLEYQDENPQERNLHDRFCQLHSMLKESYDEYNLFSANAAFIQENYPVIGQYVKNLKECFDADVKNVNFGSSKGTQVINSWISEKTNKLIPKLRDTNFDPSTRAVLLNAVYFKGTWETQFLKKKTYKGIFYNGKIEKPIAMMSMFDKKFLYFHDQETHTQYLRMPYIGDHIVMLFALPDEHDLPANLSMHHELLCRINSNLKKTELDVIRIPKFKFESTKEMKNILMGLGMYDLFIAGAANLTGITEESNLSVSSVFHTAVIEVDEKGSKASAVTSASIVPVMASFNPSFIAEHPFSFYIIEERNGMILFAGKISDP